MTNNQTDFRALCAELLEIIDFLCEGDARPDCDIVTRVRAALAQPEPTPECNEDYWRRDALERLLHAATSYRLNVYSAEELKIYEDRARAVLARWGRPAIKPVPTLCDEENK